MLSQSCPSARTELLLRAQVLFKGKIYRRGGIWLWIENYTKGCSGSHAAFPGEGWGGIRSSYRATCCGVASKTRVHISRTEKERGAATLATLQLFVGLVSGNLKRLFHTVVKNSGLQNRTGDRCPTAVDFHLCKLNS